jgi:DNA-binding NarL/FixJ family response regulator
MIHTAIVEDDPDMGQGLQLMIDSAEGFSCPHLFAEAAPAIAQLPKLGAIHVVLMDIHLQGSALNGIEAVAKLKPLMPDTQFMMCTVYEDTDHIFRALKAGATGYLLKNTPSAQLLEAIRDLHQGGSPMSGGIARKVIEAFAKLAQVPQPAAALTAREQEILGLLAKGFRYKEVAAQLFVSIDTVRTHVRNIYEKLQVSSKVEAINKFFGR